MLDRLNPTKISPARGSLRLLGALVARAAIVAPVVVAAACAILTIAGCSSDSGDEGSTGSEGSAGAGGGTTSSSSGGSGSAFEKAAQLCVDTINDYRSSLGLKPYERWTDAETCSGDQCKQDSESGTAHGAFGQCGEFAQNECPGWPGPPEKMITDCLQQMWGEGPGADFSKHGHYINMSNEQYTKAACGFYVLPDGSVWSTQNFK